MDYGATFAPVMSAASMRYLLALAAELNFEVHQMDVVTADGLGAVYADCCVFVRGDASPVAAAAGNGTFLAVGIHADDLLSTGAPLSATNDFKTSISRRFAMKDLGRIHTLLGILVRQDLMAGRPLRDLVGAVLYLAVTTRPDIFDQVRALM
ncbi:unnamed protein product [Phaeothamnion confervicola]